jgi:hypothetical protein
MNPLGSSSLVESRYGNLQLDNETSIPFSLIPSSSSSNLGTSNHVIETCIDNVELGIVFLTHAGKKRKVQWPVIKNF